MKFVSTRYIYILNNLKYFAEQSTKVKNKFEIPSTYFLLQRLSLIFCCSSSLRYQFALMVHTALIKYVNGSLVSTRSRRTKNGCFWVCPRFFRARSETEIEQFEIRPSTNFMLSRNVNETI